MSFPNLPIEILNIILSYNSHPVADLLRPTIKGYNRLISGYPVYHSFNTVFYVYMLEDKIKERKEKELIRNEMRRDQEDEAAFNAFNGVDEDELEAYYLSQMQDNDSDSDDSVDSGYSVDSAVFGF
jgi:hypothetical protein